MAVRDRIVAAVLAAGVLLGMAAWQGLTPLLGIAVVLAALLGACLVYRIDPGSHPRDVDEPDAPRDGVSRPRRAAQRP